MRKILVLRGGALGDFIVTLPALAALRRHWPAAHIELTGNATAAQLARTRGLLDAVHSQHEARWGALYGAEPLPADFAAWVAQFDLVLNYWPDPESELARRFPVRTGQTFLSADALPRRTPAAAHYGEPLRALGLATENHFLLPNSSAARSQQPTRFTVAIHPGSGSPRKNWASENWLALMAALPSPISLLLGEAEGRVWDAQPLPPNVTRVRNLPLEELVAHFAHCRLFLGHDSGISHLAAACGVPCLLLFGPTDPAMWAPPVKNVRVLRRGPTLAAISRADVLHEVTAALTAAT